MKLENQRKHAWRNTKMKSNKEVKICGAVAHRFAAWITVQQVLGLILTGGEVCSKESWTPEKKSAHQQKNENAVAAVGGQRVSSTKKSTHESAKIKVMLVCFFTVKGVIHHEFVSRSQIVNKEVY